MTRSRRPYFAATVAVLSLIAIMTAALTTAQDERRPDYRPSAHAIRGAKIVDGTGRTLEPGTVLVRRGVIEAVGPVEEVEIPADAEVIEGEGLTVYPGFLDLYTVPGVAKGIDRSATGPGRNVPYGEFALPSTPPDNRSGLTPEFQVGEALVLPAEDLATRRRLGFTALLAAPGGSIATGQSALVSLAGTPRRESILRSPLGLHITLRPPTEPPTPPGPDEDPVLARRRLQGTTVGYPTSLMGTIAHLRQAMLDSEYDHQAWEYYRSHGGPRPDSDPSLQAFYKARTRSLPTWWEANGRDEIHRALDLAREFGTTAILVGGREAGRAVDRLKDERVPVVLRVDFPEEPQVPDEAAFRKRDPAERVTGRRILENRKAKWTERVEAASVLEKAGVPFAFSTDGLERTANFHTQVRKAIEHGLSADAAVEALTRRAAEIAGVSDRLGSIEPGKLGHLVVMSGPYGDSKSKFKHVLIDGLKFDIEDEPAGRAGSREEQVARAESGGTGRAGQAPARKGEAGPANDPVRPAEEAKPNPGDESQRPDEKPHLEDQPPDTPFIDVASELDDDRKPKTRTGSNVLIKDAKILTVSPAGTLERASILIRDGKIIGIGPDLETPDGVTVIDAKGLVAMPGIIDTHSHMAISGGVNEMSLSIVPEVRVSDVINGDDPTIYRALAGGTTAARLLHGSANAIGGQDAVIKLKYGEPANGLILRDDQRPTGVKFALGENVTRRRERFPNTRMGVEAAIERAFLEGHAYAEAREARDEAVKRGENPPPLRRDLRLEALANILDGSFKIHSHCYRSDEILMLLRLAERFGVRVQSLQHVLEGYKVAAEIAAHGASASTFSDWWAYKVEAYDAIPYNAALITEAGGRVCIKSDSDEVVRHLYLEAAKMVKYGGVSEVQALEMITLNPARELGLDHRLGSIEVGKDADIALFTAHPLDGFARCAMSLIDGEVWFERQGEEDLDSRPGDDAFPAPSGELHERAVKIEEQGSGVYAIVGATIHPVSSDPIDRGTVVVADGRITAVGTAETEIPEGAYTIEAHGLHVWPGMIDAGSLVGLFEIGSLPETQDFSDSAPFQPELSVTTALRAESAVIPVTRANGILTALVQPTGGTISGQASVVAFDGWLPTDMVRKDRAALVVNIPAFSPPSADGGRPRTTDGDPNRRRKERLDAIREQFRLALAYDTVLKAARDGKVQAPTPDPRLEALTPYARGERLVVFRAERAREILDALELIESLSLKAAISGGADAWKVADAIKRAKVPVIVAGTLRLPLDATDPYDAPYANPARLHSAGVSFAIRAIGQGPDQATSARNLPYDAATAIAYGLPEEEALKAVTLYPARILGIDDEAGSIEPGKRADLVVTAGHLLQPTTEVKALFIGGRPVSVENKQTELYERYRGRLGEIRAGRALLGLDRKSPRPAVGGGSAPIPAPTEAEGRD